MYCSKIKLNVSPEIGQPFTKQQIGKLKMSAKAATTIRSLAAKPHHDGVILSPLQTFIRGICADNANLLLLPILISRNLTTLDIRLGTMTNWSVSHFLRMLPQQCPGIVRLLIDLQLDHFVDSLAYGSALAVHIHKWTRMEEFDISRGTMVMTEELLTALSRLPKLRSMRWMYYTSRPAGSKPVLEGGCFPALEEFFAGIPKKATLKTFDTPYFPLKQLRKAAVIVYNFKPSLIKRYFETVMPKGRESNMETFQLLQHRNAIEFDDILNITNMQFLKRLDIKAQWLLLTDQNLADLLSSLPLLEYIKLSEFSRDETSRDGNPTLLSVHSLIQHCPLLERSELFLDAREIPSIPHPVVTERQSGRLLRLRVRNSVIENPEMVAKWLKGCLRSRYDRIRIWNPKGVDSGWIIRRQNEQAWGKVQEILGHDELEEGEDFDAYVNYCKEVDYELYEDPWYEDSYAEDSEESDL